MLRFVISYMAEGTWEQSDKTLPFSTFSGILEALRNSLAKRRALSHYQRDEMKIMCFWATMASVFNTRFYLEHNVRCKKSASMIYKQKI